jgi:GntR family transcriptional regulator/MocR family aminotransferase
MALARRHLPGAQAVAEYALTPPARPALAIGYGVIDAEEIAVTLGNLRAALPR